MRPGGRVSIALELPETVVEEIARRAAEIIEARTLPTPVASPWLDTKGAADYLATGPDRIHDLVQRGQLHPRRDGRRLLFKRSDLAAYIEGES